MPLTEDLGAFFNDFGVSCTAGAVSALGILDMPSQVLVGDQVLSTDYTLTAKASDFGNLLYGDSITVAGVAYTVREARLIDDGAIVELGLQKP
jgi:riboflavin synthase alpha subunit